MNFNKICLGTANIGDNYGLENKRKINDKDIKKIFKYLIKKKINFIDTAFSYKNSHRTIKNNFSSNFKIITKLPIPNKNIKNISQWIIKKVVKEQIYFNNQIDILLLHNTKMLRKKRIEIETFNALEFLKKNKIINKVGLSVYYPSELDKWINRFRFDAVELPINIFNREFETTGWLKKLKKKKINIIARSIFLKGLLLKSDYNKFKAFKPWFKHFQIFDFWTQNMKISRLEASVRFIKSYKEIDLIIFGIRNFNQLKEICKIIKKKPIKVPDNISVKNRKLTNPKNWAIS
ncbi:aldo/keto reductase [Candidatus Pelagibacter sp.]|nr:aldo/keto reductase [Candidatus Pelagibacter sp.]